MKTLIFTLMAGIFSINASFACSMAPFDAEAALSELTLDRVAFAALAIEEETVTKVTTSEVDGEYIWRNPMCPEGSWVSAVYTVKFQPNRTFGHGCVAVAKVTKRTAEAVDFGNIQVPAINEVNVEILQPAACLH